MSLFDEHDEGCKPLKPCATCRALTFLRSRLGRDFEEFLSILGVREDASVTLVPVSSDIALETLREYGDLGIRTKNCLKNDNILTVGDLIQKNATELRRTPNFGQKSLNEVNSFLRSIGHRLGVVPIESRAASAT